MKLHSDLHGEALVAEAAAWRLTSLLLERPRGSWQSDIKARAQEVVDPAIASAARAAEAASEELYQRIFGPGGAVSPREVSYCGFEDPGKLMAALQGFYHAFSFQPEREETVDHVAVEAGFVGYLFLKEAYAHKQENAEAADITRSARERFIEEHFGRCARGISERLGNAPDYVLGVFSWIAENIRMPEVAPSQRDSDEGG